jgi:hypothetical protein
LELLHSALTLTYFVWLAITLTFALAAPFSVKARKLVTKWQSILSFSALCILGAINNFLALLKVTPESDNTYVLILLIGMICNIATAIMYYFIAAKVAYDAQAKQAAEQAEAEKIKNQFIEPVGIGQDGELVYEDEEAYSQS